MSCQVSLLCSWIMEGGGKAQLGELYLVLGLVVQLEPGGEGDDGGEAVPAPPLPHVDPHDVDPLRPLVVGTRLDTQPPHCAARLNKEVLTPFGFT